MFGTRYIYVQPNLTNREVGSDTSCIMILQDLPYCTPASSPCLDSIPVTSGDCRVSCTGLYADVTQEIENRNDEKIGLLAEGGTVNTIKSFFTALVKYDSYNFKSELGRLIQSKTTRSIRKMMEAYKAYKANYLRNMVFDPSTPGLSMCLY